jgi:hypothetical protein
MKEWERVAWDIPRFTNREKTRQPRGRSFWCGCDRNKVWAGQKCRVCHRRGSKKRDRP